MLARHRIVLVDFEIEIPMVLAARIEPLSALRTTAPTAHVLVDSQDVFACSTNHGTLVSLVSRPHARLVRFTGIVAADAGVEFLAAEMLDGDDV